jgi:hypothetical protein
MDQGGRPLFGELKNGGTALFDVEGDSFKLKPQPLAAATV